MNLNDTKELADNGFVDNGGRWYYGPHLYLVKNNCMGIGCDLFTTYQAGGPLKKPKFVKSFDSETIEKTAKYCADYYASLSGKVSAAIKKHEDCIKKLEGDLYEINNIVTAYFVNVNAAARIKEDEARRA